ncbi:hypothetical protein DP73_03160 [Desulfosporosinus sp. HMP52]|nr:hypothetical protein DP73_03160 [Desulfosporosinus sp. HMP52]
MNWWKDQFNSVEKNMHGLVVCLFLLTWGSMSKILELHKYIETYIELVDEDKWQKILELISIISKNYINKKDSLKLYEYTDHLSERLVVALGNRFNKIADKIYLKYLHSYKGDDKTILFFCLNVLSEMKEKDYTLWGNLLLYSAKLYNLSLEYDLYSFNVIRIRNDEKMPMEIAQKIFDNIKNYPRDLLIVAEKVYKEMVASEIIPVGKIAMEERWFEL